jgi:hypothetical protein
LTRAPGSTLEDVRVVPNPYHIDARDLQYYEEPDKIMFLDLPPECTIKIFSENGNLIRELIHDDGSGDEEWDSLTDSGQVIVSGIYVAFVETPSGESVIRKFAVIR